MGKRRAGLSKRGGVVEMLLTDISYQRVSFGGQELCKGVIDTGAKFRQIVRGVELKDTRVLDIGCHHGMMCHESWKMGAKRVLGIDINPATIIHAQQLMRDHYPEAPIEFRVGQAATAAGEWDVIILSGTFHYFGDIKASLMQISRVLHPNGVLLAGVRLGMNNPSLEGYFAHLHEYFGEVEEKGQLLAPDNTNRVLLHCRKPLAPAAQALLILGKSGIGKSELARGLAAAQNAVHLELDRAFIYWYFSRCGRLIDIVFQLIQCPRYAENIEMRTRWLNWQLDRYHNRDIIVEGHDLTRPGERVVIEQLLLKHGWREVREIDLDQTQGYSVFRGKG